MFTEGTVRGAGVRRVDATSQTRGQQPGCGRTAGFPGSRALRLTPASDGCYPLRPASRRDSMNPATNGPQLGNRLNPILPPVIITVPEPAPEPARGRLTGPVMILALVALGIGLRAVPMVQNRNLWIDEAMLALNLVE